MEQEVVQIVFLLDAKNTETNVQTRYRSLCRACIRMLLHLSRFPNKAHQDLRWKYSFFNTRGMLAKSSLSDKNSQFLELRFMHIEKMFYEIQSELEKFGPDDQTATSVLYSSMVDAIQGTVWDSPDILSPRETVGKGKRKAWQRCTLDPEPQNFLIICTAWPGAEEDSVSGELFSSDLMALLQKKKIKLYWIYEGQPDDNKVCKIC